MERRGLRLRAYAFGHFAVDFICFYVLYINFSTNDILPYFMLYNIVAFALQPVFGAVADRLDDPRALAVVGLALAAAGSFINALAVPAMLLCALGNAIYHSSGAAVALRHDAGNFRTAGIYVAPGAIGIALGMLAGRSLSVTEPLVLLLALIAVLFVWCVGQGARRTETAKVNGASAFAVILCLVSIAIRSFVGALAVGPAGAVIITAVAVYCGKRFGGNIAARIPAYILGPAAVVAGTLLMGFLPNTWGTVVGLFLFNLAMPLTLGRVMGAMPRNAGFGFGLTAFFLIAGILPFYFGATVPQTAGVFAALGLVAAATLYFGLKNRLAPTSETAEENITEENNI